MSSDSSGAQICYKCSNIPQQEAVTFFAVGLTTHSRLIPLLSTGVAVAARVKDNSDNELHSQFADFSDFRCVAAGLCKSDATNWAAKWKF